MVRRIVCIFCLAAGLAWTADAVADEPLVLVERVIDTRYGETEQANSDFANAMNSKLLTSRRVKINESLQSITSEVYGIGSRANPEIYRALEQRITDLNGLEAPDRIAAGSKLLLPDLPPKQYRRQNEKNPYYGQPRISQGPSPDEVANGLGFDSATGATQRQPRVSDAGRRAAPLVRQPRWVPVSTARGDSSIRVISQPLTLEFAAAPADSGTDEISKDLQALKDFSARAAGVHESVLFVLDDSWPDQEEFKNAIAFFKEADALIRKTYYLGDAKWPADLQVGKATTSFPFDSDGRKSHARSIKLALEPFVKVKSKVRVVYLPLFSEQRWAKELLGEMILVDRLANGKGADLTANLGPMSDIVKEAEDTTRQILDRLPSVITGQPAATDQAIISGLMKFSQLYSMATGAPFFFSASWTIKKYEIEFGVDPELLGVVVVAAGNAADVDLYQTPVLLASRAREFPGDVVVVGNAHADGRRDGCSAFWRPPDGTPIYGLMYNGFLGAGECGTSFSTPRTAWVLAFRETMLPLVSSDASKREWFTKYRKFILGLQNAHASNELRYWFSPASVIKGLAGNP